MATALTWSANDPEFSKTQLDYFCSLDVTSEEQNIRLSGIVCTIGPACRDPKMLENMMENGMNVARLNFSHGTYNYHQDSINNIRKAIDNYSKKIGLTYPLAIALDTKGPEIRTGLLEGGSVAVIEIKGGSTIKLTSDKRYENKGNLNCLYVTLPNIENIVPIGSRIFIDDGLICLVCTNIEDSFLICSVENGGTLGSQKGVHVPGVLIELPTISEKDIQDLKFGLQQKLDMVFLSFTPNAEVISDVRHILGDKGKDIKIIAKIENLAGIKNMDEIIEAADGILIDRGDLGMAIPLNKVFLAQKIIIAKCNKAGKPIICATQMLESMVDQPRPSRAETTDIANAVLDGADCVMLSGETAKGKYPLECVKVMADICKEAEAAIWQNKLFYDLTKSVSVPCDVTQTLAISVVMASLKSKAAAIIVLTDTGRSAHLISKYKPKCPIIAVTRSEVAARFSPIFRAVFPVICQEKPDPVWIKDVELMINCGIAFLKRREFVKQGNRVVIATGWMHDNDTNTLRIFDI